MATDMKLTGIVLSSMPVGDSDRIVSLLTCEKGRISAFVRNARKSMSSLRAVSMPFTYGTFSVYASRDSYNINACENSVFFDGLSRDIEKMYYGMYFCELIKYFTRENVEEREQVRLLYTAFKALTEDRLEKKFLRRIFELRALANYGEAPNVFECRICKKTTGADGWFLEAGHGTIVCRECMVRTPADSGKSSTYIPEAVRYAMHYSITSPYKSLFSFDLKQEYKDIFIRSVEENIKHHVDKPLKTLDMLKELGGL